MAVAAIERARILVVDDDAATRELLTEVLTGEGHIVVAEATGRDGLARAIAEPFDLILSDIGLPDLDGIRLVQGLRAAGVRAPMVALSGHTEEVDRQKGRAAGFDDYLFKPIRASILRSEVARRLSGEYTPADTAVARSDPWLARAATVPAIAEIAPPAVVVPAEPSPARPRPRGVLGGLVVIAMGVPFVMQPLGVPNAASYLFVAMGGAFLVSYVRSRQYVYLIPMVTLLSFGAALLLPTWISLRPETVAPAFVAVIALGFVLAFALAPDRRWPLVPAGILGAVAGSRLVTGISPIPSALEPFLVPVVLMAVGAYLLIERPT